MIVDTGKTKLLDLQDAGLAAYKWRLFTNNFTITNATLLTDLTAAAWSGYADVTVGSVPPSTIVGTRASTVPLTPPVFSNLSLTSQTFYGWCLFDPSGAGTLIAAVNIGITTIPAGGTFALTPTITDTQE
jgi:hypothetical protein